MFVLLIWPTGILDEVLIDEQLIHWQRIKIVPIGLKLVSVGQNLPVIVDIPVFIQVNMPLLFSKMLIRKIQKAQPIVPRHIVYTFAYVVADVVHDRLVDAGHFVRFQTFEAI